jgi:hypothetical protein
MAKNIKKDVPVFGGEFFRRGFNVIIQKNLLAKKKFRCILSR